MENEEFILDDLKVPLDYHTPSHHLKGLSVVHNFPHSTIKDRSKWIVQRLQFPERLTKETEQLAQELVKFLARVFGVELIGALRDDCKQICNGGVETSSFG